MYFNCFDIIKKSKNEYAFFYVPIYDLKVKYYFS